MVARRPLVLTSGLVSELADGDSALAGYSTTQIIAGSGLVGGGYISDVPEINVALAPNPSGLIFVGDAVGKDGVAQVTANRALASGNAALPLSVAAAASGNAALSTSVAALASGNAALATALTVNPNGPVQNFVAASTIPAGRAVGLNSAGQVELVRPNSIARRDIRRATQNPSVITDIAVSLNDLFYIQEKQLYIAFFTDTTTTFPTTSVGRLDDFGNLIFSVNVVVASVNASSADQKIIYDSDQDLFLAQASSLLYVGYLNYIEGIGQFLDFSASERTYLANGNAINYVQGYYHPYSKECVFAYYVAAYGKGAIQRVKIDKLTSTATVGSINFFSQGVGYYPDIALSPTSNTFGLVYGDSVPLSGCLRTGSILSTGSGVSLDPFLYYNAQASYFNSIVYEPAVDRYLILYNNASVTVATNGFAAEISGSYLAPTQAPVVIHPWQQDANYNTRNIYNAYDKVYTRIFRMTTGFSAVVSAALSGSFLVPNSSGYLDTFSTGSIYVGGDLDVYKNKIVGCLRQAVSYGNSINYMQAYPLDSSLTYDYLPKASNVTNVIGISLTTASSGSVCSVALPGAVYTDPSGIYEPGTLYYCYAPQSGVLTTQPNTPVNWSGQVPWQPLARAVSPSGLLVLTTL